MVSSFLEFSSLRGIGILRWIICKILLHVSKHGRTIKKCITCPSSKGSNSLLLPRVRFDINALSLNIQISRSCSNRLCLNLPREFRYCNGSEFEFPSWINKPLFGSKAIVSRYPFMDIWDIKQRVLSLNLISFSWYVYLNRFQSKESLLGLIMKEHKIGKLHEASVQRFC